MTHLKIEQNNTAIEQVSGNVIEKLYQLAFSGDLDASSNLVGRLHTTVTYQSYIDYIRAKYPDLYITSDEYYIKFVDDRIEEELRKYMPNSSYAYSNYFQTHTGLTYDFAKTVPSWQNWLRDIKSTLVHFDEFQYFENVTDWNGGQFGDATNLVSIKLPNKMVNIAGWCFDACSSLDSLDIPATVQTVGRVAFRNLTSLRYMIMRPITPPTITDMNEGGIIQGGSYNIYVPDESLTAYQNAENWSTYSSMFKPLSQFTTDFPNG